MLAKFNAAMSKWTPQLHALLRIMTALVFMQHGCAKLFGFPPQPGGPGMPPLMSMGGVAGIMEVFGGLLMLLGLCTRPVAFLLSGEMAVAYFMVHQPRSLFPLVNGGDLAIEFCFVFLYFAAAGAGPWSVDAKRGG